MIDKNENDIAQRFHNHGKEISRINGSIEFMKDDMTNMQKDVDEIKLIQKDIGYMKESMRRIEDKLKDEFVVRQEFEPIKKIVYGLVSLILLGVGGAVMGLIIK